MPLYLLQQLFQLLPLFLSHSSLIIQCYLNMYVFLNFICILIYQVFIFFISNFQCAFLLAIKRILKHIIPVIFTFNFTKLLFFFCIHKGIIVLFTIKVEKSYFHILFAEPNWCKCFLCLMLIIHKTNVGLRLNCVWHCEH